MTPTSSKDMRSDIELLVSFWIVLDRATRDPFTVKSNFARHGAWHIAVCASRSLITTEVDFEIFDKRWHITEPGLVFKENLDGHIQQLIK